MHSCGFPPTLIPNRITDGASSITTRDLAGDRLRSRIGIIAQLLNYQENTSAKSYYGMISGH